MPSHTQFLALSLCSKFLSCPQPKVRVMGKEKAKSGSLARRPDNSAFKQQRLPAWSPMLTANTVLPFFYFMSLICMLLGVWLLLTVQSTQEIKVSVCENCTSLFSSIFVCGNVLKYTVYVCKRGRERVRLNALVCNKKRE